MSIYPQREDKWRVSGIITLNISLKLLIPYQTSTSCNYNPKLVKATLTGYVNIPTGSEASLKEAVATVGPISIANDASPASFSFYKGGK